MTPTILSFAGPIVCTLSFAVVVVVCVYKILNAPSRLH